MRLPQCDFLGIGAYEAGKKSRGSPHIFEIQRSHGEPCSCQLWRYSPNAASTRFESAPWEQLLRYYLSLEDGNWERIAKIELSLNAKSDSLSSTIHGSAPYKTL